MDAMKKEKALELVEASTPTEVPAAPPAKIPVPQPEVVYLQMLDAERRHSGAEVNLRLMQRENVLAKIDPEGKVTALDKEISEHAQRAQAFERKYIERAKALEARLGVSLADYTYDETTSTLVHKPEEK